MKMMEEVLTHKTVDGGDVKAIFVYYTNNKNTGREEEIYKRFRANFPQTFRLILIQTNEASERMDCIYPRFLVADDLANDLKDIGHFLRKALQLEGADDSKKKELLKTMGYEECGEKNEN
jgi:hypothetical protein